MNQKIVTIIITIIVAVLAGVAVLSQASAPAPSGSGTTSAPHETTNPDAGGTSSGSTTGAGNGTYTMADVAKHNSGTSCWTAINGGVYDVTNWINQHPGGAQAILSLCGTDGSDAFNGQHGGQRRPVEELATFKIGTLAQ